MELFGNIDDEYIVQALQPWKRQTRRYMVYHIGRKAVCLAFIVMLGLCLAFHDQVHAAVSRFTTMIAEILQISNDLEPYTDVINTTQEKDGISITLNEVILTNNSLLVSVNLDAETEYDGIGISVGESIKIMVENMHVIHQGFIRNKIWKKKNINMLWNGFMMKVYH